METVGNWEGNEWVGRGGKGEVGSGTGERIGKWEVRA